MNLLRRSDLAIRVATGAAGVLLSAVFACSSSESTAPGGGASVELVSITPTAPQVALGSTVQLTAVAYDQSGNEVAGRKTVWASADSLVASVSAAGVVTGHRAGAVQVQAVVDGKSALSVVNVVARPVGSVSVTPGTASVAAGANVQLQVAVKDDQGNPLTDRPITWLSSNDAVARVTSTGLVLGASPGNATITASAGEKSGSAAVTVTGTVAPPPPGGGPAVVSRVAVQPSPTANVFMKDDIQFTATAFDASGNVITGRTVTWSSSDTRVAAIDASGKAHGDKVGTTTITATIDGKSASTTLTVGPKAATSVAVSGPSTLAIGAAGDVTATALDVNKAVLDDRSIEWTSSAEAVATVVKTAATTGRVTAKSPGTATITATVAGETVSSSIFVTVPAPAAPTPPANQAPTADFTVSCTELACTFTDASSDADGSIASRSWNFGDNATSTLSSVSHSYAAAGTYTVALTATDDGGATATKTRSVTVAAPPPAAPTTTRVDVTAPSPAFAVGGTQQFTAAAYDASGTKLDGRSFTWSSSNTAVATVSTTGLVTAVKAGSATISATTDGVVGSVAITVSAPLPATAPPVANFTYSCTNRVCAFYDGTTDSDGSVSEWQWSFGDGQSSPYRNADVTYSAFGTYAVSLTATDDKGATGTATKSVVAAKSKDVRLRNAKSGKCLSVRGDTRMSQFAPMVVRKCDAGPDQIYALPSGGGPGPVELTQFDGLRYMVYEGNLRARSWSGSPGHRWTFTASGQLRNYESNTCVVVANEDDPLQLAPCTGSSSQRWEVITP